MTLLWPRPWIANLAAVGTCASFFALALRPVLEVALLPSPSVGLPALSRPAPCQPGRLDAPRLAALTGLEASTGTSVSAAVPPLRSQLWGTLASNRAQYSAALISTDGTFRTARIGDELEGGSIVAIERARVLVRRGAAIDAVLPVEAGASPSSSSPVRPAVVERSTSLGLGQSLRQLDAHTYELQRAELEHAAANLHLLAREALFTPVVGQSGLEGFRLTQLREGALLARLGAQRGDVVRRINGQDLSSPEAMLGVLSKLRSWNTIEIELERQGSVVRNRYHLR